MTKGDSGGMRGYARRIGAPRRALRLAKATQNEEKPPNCVDLTGSTDLGKIFEKDAAIDSVAQSLFEKYGADLPSEGVKSLSTIENVAAYVFDHQTR